MAARNNLNVLFLVLLAVANLLHGSKAQTSASTPVEAPAPTTTKTPSPAPAKAPLSGPVTYTVGDTLGWTVPTNGAAAYRAWTSGKTFKVGDILVFNYPLNAHNVEEVTKAQFDSCNSASPIATYTKPPVRVTLNKTGTHYFICGVTGHCPGGQKLAVNVGGGSATSPSPSAAAAATPPSASASGSPSPSSPGVNPSSPSPNSSLSPPPENSGAASLGVAGLLLSIAAAAFFY